MRHILVCIYVLLCSIQMTAQETCACANSMFIVDEKIPKKTFALGNGNNIGLCGYTENDTVFSEFVLYDCNTKQVIGEWDAVKNCTVEENKDTLFVSELHMFPVGVNFEYQYVPFYTTSIYYIDGSPFKVQYFNAPVRKYTNEEIKAVFNKIDNAVPGNTEDNLAIAEMLFWSYVSGDKQAEQYLNTVEKKLGPFDGYIAEEWDKTREIYALYKAHTK